jgi:hypothetical protein
MNVILAIGAFLAIEIESRNEAQRSYTKKGEYDQFVRYK